MCSKRDHSSLGRWRRIANFFRASSCDRMSTPTTLDLHPEILLHLLLFEGLILQEFCIVFLIYLNLIAIADLLWYCILTLFILFVFCFYFFFFVLLFWCRVFLLCRYLLLFFYDLFLFLGDSLNILDQDGRDGNEL